MNVSRSIVILGVVVAVLSTAAAMGGLALQEPGKSQEFTSARGESVVLFGRGLYRYDTVFSGANYRAQDIVTLALGVPSLFAALLWYRRGSYRGGMVLLGMFGFFVYEYASMSFMASFNQFFLVYVAILSAALFGLVLTFRALELRTGALGDAMPRRLAGWFMIAGGAVTTIVWLLPLLSAQLSGRIPAHLDHNTTMVTDALDLAIITPACFVAGTLILKRNPVGYLVAMPLIGIIVMLLPLIGGGTASQIAEGVVFSPAEIIGPISGFAVLGLCGVILLVRMLRGADEAARETPK